MIVLFMKFKQYLASHCRLQDKKNETKVDTISIEELIEQKRAELSASSNLTPVTLQSFIAWKKRKLREKAEQAKYVNNLV